MARGDEDGIGQPHQEPLFADMPVLVPDSCHTASVPVGLETPPGFVPRWTAPAATETHAWVAALTIIGASASVWVLFAGDINKPVANLVLALALWWILSPAHELLHVLGCLAGGATPRGFKWHNWDRDADVAWYAPKCGFDTDDLKVRWTYMLCHRWISKKAYGGMLVLPVCLPVAGAIAAVASDWKGFLILTFSAGASGGDFAELRALLTTKDGRSFATGQRDRDSGFWALVPCHRPAAQPLPSPDESG